MDALVGKDMTLWLHSFSTFCLIEDIIEKSSNANLSTTLPLTMLMHDIGQVVLQKLNPASHKIALIKSEEEKIPLHEAEIALIGLDHGTVGGWLMESWGMTEDIIIPITYHHEQKIPEKYYIETAILKLTDWLDCEVRQLPAVYPSEPHLTVSQLDDFDQEWWLKYHGDMLEEIDASNPANMSHG